MNLWEAKTSGRFLQEWLNTHGGRGSGQRLAAAMKVHPSLVSQVIRGNRHLTLDQTEAACQFLGFSPLESEYFLALVERERAATPALRRRMEDRLVSLRKKAQEVRAHLADNRELDEVSQGRFYSSGDYSAVRLASSLPNGKSVEGIADLLGLPRARVAEILEFLLQKGLVVQNTKGELELGPARVHVPASSPFVVSHHRNWRARAALHLEHLTEEELAFTSPLTIAKKDLPKVRSILLEAIARIREVVEKSEAEELVALTMDLWHY